MEEGEKGHGRGRGKRRTAAFLVARMAVRSVRTHGAFFSEGLRKKERSRTKKERSERQSNVDVRARHTGWTCQDDTGRDKLGKERLKKKRGRLNAPPLKFKMKRANDAFPTAGWKCPDTYLQSGWLRSACKQGRVRFAVGDVSFLPRLADRCWPRRSYCPFAHTPTVRCLTRSLPRLVCALGAAVSDLIPVDQQSSRHGERIPVQSASAVQIRRR
jgi:hypothetical protein